MTTPAAVPDPLDVEPTDADIAAAAEDERRDAEAATRALRDAADATPPKKSPGRPKGSKNRSKAETTARTAAKKTTVTPTRPKLSGAAKNAADEAAARKRDEHKAQVQVLTEAAREFRPALVQGIGMLTGLPPDFLVGIQADDAGRPLDIEGEPLRLDPNGAPLPGQNPAVGLTHYGEALAPKEWQIRIVADAGLRLMDSDQGAALLAMWERYAPILYGVAAVGCVGVYTVSTLQAVSAIKPMVQIEMQERANAAAAAAGNQPPPADGGLSPDGSSAGPTG